VRRNKGSIREHGIAVDVKEGVMTQNEMADQFRELIKAISAASPGYNLIAQIFFCLPERVSRIYKAYPSFAEEGEDVMRFLGLEFSPDGRLTTSGVSSGIARPLASLLKQLFYLLSQKEQRERLLQLMGTGEEEFHEIDPLRAWMETIIPHLRETQPQVLAFLDSVIDHFGAGGGNISHDRSSEILSVSFQGRTLTPEEHKNCCEILSRFCLVIDGQPFIRNTPFALDVYKDLREQVREARA